MTSRVPRFVARTQANAAAEDERAALLGPTSSASRRPGSAEANDAGPTTSTPPAAPAARSAWLPCVTSSPGLLPRDSSPQPPPPPPPPQHQQRRRPSNTAAAAVTADLSDSAAVAQPTPSPPPQPDPVAVSPSTTKRRYLSGSGTAAAAASSRHQDAAAGNLPAVLGYRHPPATSAAAATAAPATAASASQRSRSYAAFLAMRRRTVVLINLVSIMERMDEQIVPALSRPLGCAFRAGPHQLGLITFARALVQAVASPLGGLAGHFLDRVVVLFLGCAIWGFFCTAFSFATTVRQGIAAWAFNGIGLSLIIPNSQSLVADYYTATQRGEAFGTLMLTGALGGMLGTMFATNLGGLTPMGMAGWRVAFMAVGAVSLAIGAFTLLLAVDPTRHHTGSSARHSSTRTRTSNTRGGRGRRHQPQHHPKHGQLQPDGLEAGTHGSVGAVPEPTLPGRGDTTTGRAALAAAPAVGGKASTSSGAGVLRPSTSGAAGTDSPRVQGSHRFSDEDDGEYGEVPTDTPSCFQPSDRDDHGEVGDEESLSYQGRWGAPADDPECVAVEEQPLLRLLRYRSKSLESTINTTITTTTTSGLPGGARDGAGQVSAAASASPPASPAEDSAVGDLGLGRPLLRRYKPSAQVCNDARQHQGHEAVSQQHGKYTSRCGGYGYPTRGSPTQVYGTAEEVGTCTRSKSVPTEWRKGSPGVGGGSVRGGGGGRGSSGSSWGGDGGGEVVVAGCSVEGGGYESSAAAAATVLTSSPAGRPALTWRRIWEMITTPTFLIIILQGIVGSTPWNALVFLTLYLQLIGFSDATASSLMALFLGGTAAGALVGGWLGDRVAERYPHHGRVALVQFSVGIGVPLAVLMMRGLPMTATPGSAVMYAGVMLLKGVLTSWAAPACNNPVFAEIVPPDMRNLVYAFDRSFEGAISALGAPLVGMAAERWFGFTGVAGGDQACEHHNAMAGTDPDLPKARALGDAMLLFMAVPWTLCAIFYTGLHWSYPRDRARALRPQVVLEVSEGPGDSSRGMPASVLPYKAPYGGLAGRSRGKPAV